MSLNNVDSSNGYLEALARGGTAVSNAVTQEETLPNVPTISKSTLSLGTADIIPAWPYASGSDTNLGWYCTSRIGSRPWFSCDVDLNGGDAMGRSAYDGFPLWFQLQKIDGIPMTFRGLEWKNNGGTSYSEMTAFQVMISDDGINWTTIYSGTSAGKDYTIYNLDFGQEYTAFYMRLNVTATTNAFDGWSMRNFELNPQVSVYDSTADTLITDTLLTIGQDVLIQLDDDSYVEWTVDNISGTGPYTVDTTAVTAGETPTRVFDDYEVAQPDFGYMNLINCDIKFVNISGVGSTADTLVTDTQLVNGDKLVIVKDDDSIHEFVAAGVSGVGPYTMDTASVTAGEIPSRVFIVGEYLSINDVDLSIYRDTYSLSGADLISKRRFNDISITGRSVTTKATFSSAGNIITRIGSSIYKNYL